MPAGESRAGFRAAQTPGGSAMGHRTDVHAGKYGARAASRALLAVVAEDLVGRSALDRLEPCASDSI